MKSLKNGSFIMVVFLVFILTTSLIGQNTKNSVEVEVIALTYKLWKAENEHDMATRNKYVSDDYTEFSQAFSTRVDGKNKNFTLSDAGSSGSTSLADEMLNPKVQVYGDVAVLTYNFAGVRKDNNGNTINIKAKSTRVYVKTNGDWKLVHANFGYDPDSN